jgi:hypothetical protein
MLKNNLDKSKEHNYFDIVQVDGKWFAWFYEEVQVKTQDILEVKK